MSEDSDQEISELDIGTKTWNKLETNMKLFGFREGALQGKNLALQQGFNLGYVDGFKLGEYLGRSKGVINCESELQQATSKPHFEEETIDKLFTQSCVVCLEEKNTNTTSSEENPFQNLDNLIKLQKNHNNEVIKTLQNSDLEPYFDKS